MWRKPVILEELQAMSDEEVILKINEFLVPPNRAMAPINPADLVAAQFYMGELDRRAARRLEKERVEAENRREAIEEKRWAIDQRNECVIIGLIGVEIFLAILLAIWGDLRQTADVNKQLAAFNSMQAGLQQLDETSKATAAAMTTLKTTTGEMNEGVQKQLGLNYDVTVILGFDPQRFCLNIENQSKGNVFFWGYRIGNLPPSIKTDGWMITPGSGTCVPCDRDYNKVRPLFQKPNYGNVPWEVFLKNQNGTEFIAETPLTVGWSLNDDNPLLSNGSTVMRRANWLRRNK